MILGMHPLMIMLYAVSFVVGLAMIPLTAYLARGGLPAFISEPLANLLMLVTMFGAGSSTLHQTETDEYELRRAEPDELGPRRNWNRFYGSRFGLTYERSEDAFDQVADISPSDMQPESRFGNQDVAEVDIERNGEGSFVDVTIDASENLLIPLGRKVAELRNAAGLSAINVAQRNALEEYGGDTSDLGGKIMLGGMFMFLISGVVTGYVVFF